MIPARVNSRMFLLAVLVGVGAAVIGPTQDAQASESTNWSRVRPVDIVAAPRIEVGAALRRAPTVPSLPEISPTTLGKAQWLVCDPCKRKRRWQLVLGPYGWLASVHGTAWSEGQGRHFEIDFDTLKDFASGGFMFYAEFRYDRWFLAFDGTWATLQHDFKWRLGDFGFKVKQRIYELRLGYRIIGAPHGEPCDCKCSPCPPAFKQRFAMDAYLGARYWSNETTLRIGLGPLASESTSEDDWTDPFVGLRFHYQIAPKWTMDVRGDVGGFGVGKASDFAYNTFLGFGWHFAKHWTLALGWRTQGTDRVKPKAASVRGGVDIHQTGPLIGLLWRL